MDKSTIFDFLLRNERYMEYLKSTADNNICSNTFTELIVSNLSKIGIDKSSIDKWNKLVHKNFSPQLDAVWEDGRVVISGIKDGRYEMIELDNDLLESKKTRRLLEIMDANLGVIYGYSIEGKTHEDNYQFHKYLKSSISIKERI
jgi:hypothetical protein